MLKYLFGITFCLCSIASNAQRLVKELLPDSSYTYITFMGNTQKGFVFNFYDLNYGTEPWISDGTEAGTQLLKDILPGLSTSTIVNSAYSNDTIVYFQAFKDNTANVYLWRTDGTSAGTFIVDSFGRHYLQHNYNEATFYKGEFYYIVSNSHIKTLSATNGTVNGTRKIMSFKDSDFISRTAIKVFNNKLYFFAYDSAHGVELWQSDGTTAGTKLFSDIYSGPISSHDFENRRNMVTCRDKLFFMAKRNPIEGTELLYISSQTLTPQLFKNFTPLDYNSSTMLLAEGNDSIFFINDLIAPGICYVSDGTLANTKKFQNLNQTSPLNNIASYSICKVNEQILINSAEPNTGIELFRADAQYNNLGLLKDINPGSESSLSTVSNIVVTRNRAYFIANSPNFGTDLWVTDGSSDSTYVYLDFIGNDITNLSNIHKWKNRVFFSGILDNSMGSELYELILNKYTDISEQSISETKLFPNPIRAGEDLHLPESTTQISLYNLCGQLVWQSEVTNEVFKLPADISPGLYTVLCQNNYTIHTQKLLIQ